MIELIITNQTAVRSPAGSAIFFFVNLFEERALIPRSAFKFLQHATRLLFRDIHHADLQLFVGLAVVDEIMEPAPGSFERFEVFMMKDQIDLLGKLPVQL